MTSIPARDPPPPPPNDEHWQALIRAASLGEPLYVEVDMAAGVKPGIRGIYVNLTQRATVRCGILRQTGSEDQQELIHFESDRIGAGRWLRYHGVPVIRIGFRLAEKFHIYPAQTLKQDPTNG